MDHGHRRTDFAHVDPGRLYGDRFGIGVSPAFQLYGQFSPVGKNGHPKTARGSQSAECKPDFLLSSVRS